MFLPTPASRRNAAKTLVFCVALNHYDTIYAANIASHRRYATEHGYHYALVRKPVWSSLREAVWLKIVLLDAALKAGWDWVLFVDADCEIRPQTPLLETLAEPEKQLYLAAGFSGNVNSGVIIARNGLASRAFFHDVLMAADTSVPEEDWGENGHIIHFAKRTPVLCPIDRRWNNNTDPALADFIRHYSAGGPMRPLYPFTPVAKAVTLLVRVVNKVKKWIGAHDVPKGALVARLQALCHRVQREHPAFVSVSLHSTG